MFFEVISSDISHMNEPDSSSTLTLCLVREVQNQFSHLQNPNLIYKWWGTIGSFTRPEIKTRAVQAILSWHDLTHWLS
jgi:hypothetical protein